MYNRFQVQFIALLFGATLVAACSIDSAGLETSIGRGSGGTFGTGGRVGTMGTGGAVTNGSGGVIVMGTGGVGGRVGAMGTGGAVTSGSGGVMGTGGVTGTGGVIGTGGATGSNTCNPSTCPDGCCMGSNCVTNHNDKTCGTAGAACGACGACYQCSGLGVCEPDPAANWDVICSSVSIAPTKPLGVAWDLAAPGINPLPDPYCQFTLDGVSQARTLTVLNTLTPVWDQLITPPNVDVTENFLVSQAGRWQVGVIDDDTGPMPVDPVCAATPHLTPADFAAGSVVLPAAPNCTDLTIQLVCVP